MSHHIDPLILKKLEAFARRRRKLIIFRGICAALATLLVTMMIIALIDRLFRLPDAARWAMSLTAYAAVLIVEWRSSLQLLMQAPGPRKLARLVEHAEPKLREDLLSAVELGDARSDAAFDSEEFRALVQTDVAHRMEGLNVERLLPVNLVRRYIGLAALIVVGCIAAFALSGGQFGTLLLRALAPGANLDRVSRVKVKVVEPASPDMVVPQGETIPLVIELGGQRANAAEVEMLTASGTERVKMTPIGPDRFSASIQVGREDVLYRIYAGDAVTKKYRLHAVARPHVVKFDKTFRFPAYTRMEPKQSSEENGDLAALEGTEVELRLQTNQPIKDGELRVEQGKSSYVVKLASDGGQLTGTVSLSASGTYRVQLVSAETGFENKFSPEYELRAEPDLVPQVDLEAPKQDLILASNEIVDLLGTAKDDQSLAKVMQLVKVNDGKWKETVLVEMPGANAAVERRWDLYEQGVKPGDLVTTKLVAIDMKGSRGESRPLQITITKSGFETSRLDALEAQQALHETLKALRTAGDVLEKTSNETREQFERLPDGDAQRRTVAVGAGALADTFTQQLAAAWAQLFATLKAAEPGHTTADLVQVGRLLSRIDANHLQVAKDAQGIVAANPESPMAREIVREWAEGNMRAAQRARFAEEVFRPLLYSETLQIIAENVQVVAREQARLAALAQNTGNDKSKWAQLANRVRVVLSEARALESLLDRGAQTGGGDRLKQAARRLEKERTAIERVLAAGEPSSELNEPIQRLSRVTVENVRAGFEMVRDQSHQATEAHMKIVRDVQPTYSTFEKLRQELQQWNAAEKLTAETRSAIASRRMELRGLSLKQHGDLEETRRDADSEFVNDARTATRALEGVRIKSAEAGREATNAQLVALDKNFRLLETAHNLLEALSGLNQLVVAERWEIAGSQARTVNLRDWRWLETRLRALPDELGKMQAEPPLRDLVQQAQRLLWEAQKLSDWKGVAEEMNRRADPERAPETASREVTQIAAQVKQAFDLLRKPIDEARQQLAEMAPKLSEIAEQLAKETKELKKETEEQAQKAAEKKPEEAQVDSKTALAQQQNLNERVEALKDAVRAEANRQDILSKEGREAARDADDALALLKEPPPKAEAALADAVQAQLPSAKTEALTEATKEQQKLSDALDLLAKHFENAEQGKPEETRMALRATEEMTGIKAAMDAQAARAEQLAQMAQQSPEELLKQLEAALPQNPTMQKELSQITQNTLSNAQEKLSEAVRAETDVAQLVTEMAAQSKDAAPKNLKEAAATAKLAAREAAQAAQAAQDAANEAVQKAQQANNGPAAEQARGARAETESAKQMADRAVQATDRMNDEKQMAEAARETAQSAAEAARDANEAAQAAQQSQATAQQAANKESGQQQAKTQDAAKASAHARDAAQKAEQAAKKAEMAARQLAAMSQQASEQREQMARNEAAMQGARQQASAKAKQAAVEAASAAQAAHAAANEAVQTAKQADNQPAADQARAARTEAQNAMHAAQRGAQAAEQIADPKQAVQAGQKAAQMAAEAAKNAQNAAQAAQQSQATAQQSAAKESGDQQSKNQAASREAGEAIQAAQKAAQAAKKAEAAAMEAAAIAQQSGDKNAQMAQNAANAEPGQQPQNASPPNNPMLAQAAQQQQPIAQNAAQAGAEVERAGRHEERLMNAPAGQQLQQLGAEISETAMTEVPAAESALGQAQQAAQAQQAVSAASNELRRELGQLEAAASQPPASQTAPASTQIPQAQASTSSSQTPMAQSQSPKAPSAISPQTSAQQAAAQAAAAPAGGAQPANARAAQATPANTQPANAESAQPGSQPGSPSAPAQTQSGAEATSQAQAAAVPASPQEQVWMARTLDALDAIMHSPPSAMAPDAQGQQAGESQNQAGQQAQPAQGQPQQGAAQSQQGNSSAQAAAQSAQQAMAAAAQAAAAAMRGARSETPGETPGAPTSSSRSAVSKGGAKAESPSMARGALPDGNSKAGEWGKLPKQMAEQLSRGQSEAVAGEYRHQVETYYRVIAEKSKKP